MQPQGIHAEAKIVCYTPCTSGVWMPYSQPQQAVHRPCTFRSLCTMGGLCACKYSKPSRIWNAQRLMAMSLMWRRCFLRYLRSTDTHRDLRSQQTRRGCARTSHFARCYGLLRCCPAMLPTWLCCCRGCAVPDHCSDCAALPGSICRHSLPQCAACEVFCDEVDGLTGCIVPPAGTEGSSMHTCQQAHRHCLQNTTACTMRACSATGGCPGTLLLSPKFALPISVHLRTEGQLTVSCCCVVQLIVETG